MRNRQHAYRALGKPQVGRRDAVDVQRSRVAPHKRAQITFSAISFSMKSFSRWAWSENIQEIDFPSFYAVSPNKWSFQ
jgi:hypothetical protein